VNVKFKRHVGEQEDDTNLWIGYCAFHLGDYKRALEVSGENPTGVYSDIIWYILMVAAKQCRRKQSRRKAIALSAFPSPMSFNTGIH
jgi:hypothetical protein